MHVDTRPPPVVTIVDPARPGPLGDLVVGGGHDLPDPPSAVQLIAGGLSAVLLVGLTAVAVHRQARAEDHRLTRQALAGVQLSLGVSGLSNDARQIGVGYDVISKSAEPVELVAANVEGAGWHLEAALPQRLTDTVTASVGAVRDLDCAQPATPRPVLTVTVRVRGHTRVVSGTPPEDTPLLAGRLVDAVCGQIGAAEAVSNTTGVARRVGDHLMVDLNLVNAGVYPVSITGAFVDGLRLTGLSLPLRLDARPPGPLDLKAGVTHRPVTFELRMGECLAAGQLPSGPVGPPTTVELTAVGRGKVDTAFAPVAHLGSLEAQLRLQRCPHVLP